MGKKNLFLLGSFFGLFLVVPTLLAASTAHYERTLDELSQAMATHQRLQAEAVGYDVAPRRDPLRSLIDENGNVVNSQGPGDSLAVQGIVRSKDLELALVNDQFYKVGDQVGPYKILEIRPDGLFVEREGKTLFIPLYPQSRDKSAAP